MYTEYGMHIEGLIRESALFQVNNGIKFIFDSVSLDIRLTTIARKYLSKARTNIIY